MNQTNKRMNIAIDGPAGAGKSSVAKKVAEALGFVYVDTGAMYRVVAYKAIQCGILPDDKNQVAKLARKLDIHLEPGEEKQQVFADGENVTDKIRDQEVTSIVSIIAQNPQVREVLMQKQKQIAAAKGVVMDGRDIGTKVLPDAEVKVFLTASVEERARRRFLEIPEGQTTMEQLKADLSLRDEMDQNRTVSPLLQAADAELLDSTGMSMEQVVARILELCHTRAAVR